MPSTDDKQKQNAKNNKIKIQPRCVNQIWIVLVLMGVTWNSHTVWQYPSLTTFKEDSSY